MKVCLIIQGDVNAQITFDTFMSLPINVIERYYAHTAQTYVDILVAYIQSIREKHTYFVLGKNTYLEMVNHMVTCNENTFAKYVIDNNNVIVLSKYLQSKHTDHIVIERNMERVITYIRNISDDNATIILFGSSSILNECMTTYFYLVNQIFYLQFSVSLNHSTGTEGRKVLHQPFTLKTYYNEEYIKRYTRGVSFRESRHCTIVYNTCAYISKNSFIGANNNNCPARGDLKVCSFIITFYTSNIFIPIENCLFDIEPSFHFDDICTRFILEGRDIYISEHGVHKLLKKDYSFEYDVFIPNALSSGKEINSVYALTQYVAILIARTLCSTLKYVQVNLIYFCTTDTAFSENKGLRYPICVNDNVPLCTSTLSALQQRKKNSDGGFKDLLQIVIR